MALLSQLIAALGDEFGEPEAGLTVVARALREANFISTGGRGRSAAHMQEQDLASLLLALAAPGDHTKAADTLRQVGNLKLTPIGSAQFVGLGDFILDIKQNASLGVTVGQSMLDALTFLLCRYDNGAQSDLGQSAVTNGGDVGLMVGKLQPDTRPSELSLQIRRDRYGWSGSISAQLAGGDHVSLPFTSSGDLLKDPHRPPPKDALRGRCMTGDLYPSVVHTAINCVRGTDHTFRRHVNTGHR